MMGISIKGQRIGAADVIDIDVSACGAPRHIGVVRIGGEERRWVDGYHPSYNHDVSLTYGDGWCDVTVTLTGAVRESEMRRVALS